jgi:hypothetical protein
MWGLVKRIDPDAYAQGRVKEGPGILNTGFRGLLCALPAPDPRLAKEIPAAAPAERTVVFHPKMEVEVVADCGDAQRNRQATATMTRLLEADGMKIGPGSGWKYVVKGEVIDTSATITSGGTTINVPAIQGSVRLVAPDGQEAGGGEHKAGLFSVDTRYIKKREYLGTRVIIHYDFGGRDPRTAFADEFWEAWLKSLDKPPRPRAAMKADGKYVPLPVPVSFDVAAPGS